MEEADMCKPPASGGIYVTANCGPGQNFSTYEEVQELLDDAKAYVLSRTLILAISGALGSVLKEDINAQIEAIEAEIAGKTGVIEEEYGDLRGMLQVLEGLLANLVELGKLCLVAMKATLKFAEASIDMLPKTRHGFLLTYALDQDDPDSENQ
jgi:hypothetical protein